MRDRTANKYPDKLVIGIDPDIKRSGVAICCPGTAIATFTAPLWGLFDYLSDNKVLINTVYIEAGWLNKRGLSFTSSSRRGVCAGMNHGVGKIIHDYCNHLEINSVPVRPRGHKWTHEELVRLTRSDKSRSNQEERDAARTIIGVYMDMQRDRQSD